MPLVGIVTGLEHSGTTYLADLIKSHPQINGGFECGVLLGDNPADFPSVKPFYQWMQKARHPSHWGITPQAMKEILAADNWNDMYKRIIQYSPLFNGPVTWLLDKTPRYMPILDKVMAAVKVPVIVVFKETDFQYLSYKSRNISLLDYFARYQHYYTGFFNAYDKYAKRILMVPHTTLCKKPGDVLMQVYKFLNVPVPEPILPEETIYLTPGPVRSNYDPKQEREALSSLTEEERQLINRFKVDEALYRITNPL